MIFVDTSAWFAVYSQRDRNHVAATLTLAATRERLVTTDYVVDETITFLAARGERAKALDFGREVFRCTSCSLEWLTPEDVQKAWILFEQVHDKKWSFTDCTRRIVMQRLAIDNAFAINDHFHQFGNVRVIPAFETET